ncbi:MAG: hypothetical protein DRQ54_05005 [Gammaproteobacteria bacterium]|nr:MAG: hypothetical protein DRQ54_05005 [Gammaproteobacteria bacterium]
MRTAYYSNENGNTVVDNVLVEAVGAELAIAPFLYAGTALNNEMTYSSDLSQWISSTGATATYDQVGLSGLPNTASLLTDDSTTSTLERSHYITAIAGANLTLKVTVEKQVSATNLMGIQMQGTVTGTAPAVSINLETGAIVLVTAGIDNFEVIDAGPDWVIYLDYPRSGAEEQFRNRIYPCRYNLGGVADALELGSIIVKQVEMHSAKTIGAVRGAAPVYTNGSAVAAPRTQIQFDVTNHYDANGSYYAECVFMFSGEEAGTKDFSIINTDDRRSAGSVIMMEDGYKLESRAEGATSLSANDGDFITGQVMKVGVAYGPGSAEWMVVLDGIESTELTDYPGTFEKGTGNSLRLMAEVTSLQPYGAMLVRNVRRYALAYIDAKSKIIDLML